jgi:hypothetical protein
MQFRDALKILALLALAQRGLADGAGDPLGKVYEMLDGLKAKIIKDSEAEAKAYHEYFEWCDETARDKGFEITTAASKKEELEATIGKKDSDAKAASEKIEKLASTIAEDEAELKAATEMREKEEAEFTANEGELIDSIDTLTRAADIIQKEMAKSSAAAVLAQVDTSSVKDMLEALKAIIGAASLGGADKHKLLALVQAKQSAETNDEDEDEEQGAPAADAYKSQSGGIFDLLEDLKEEAEEQLATLRKTETNLAHNYDMLKQSLEDSIAADTKASEEEKAVKAASEEDSATAAGELELTSKDLTGATESLELTKNNCIITAADHEASVTATAEELKVLEETEKVLKESTGGAASAASFVQVASKASSKRYRQVQNKVVLMVRHLAKDHHSAALAQLASRIAALVKYNQHDGADPFTKVKGLITDLISKLEAEAESETSEKAYCDEQMTKTEAKKAELEEDVGKLTTKIDEATAKSTKLKTEVKETQAVLAELAKQQAEMDSIRSDSHGAYVAAKADLEKGLAGIRKALEVLRDYYGGASAAFLQEKGSASINSMMRQPAPPENHEKSTGAGDSIVSLLEVVESDFAKSLAKIEAEEADSESEYQKMTQENAVTKTTKVQDLKYKTAAFTALDKAVSDLSSDLDTENAELGAVLEYYGKVKDRCIAQPESYEERKSKRDSEIKGLKEALSVLENETAFMQQRKRGRSGSRFLEPSADH